MRVFVGDTDATRRRSGACPATVGNGGDRVARFCEKRGLVSAEGFEAGVLDVLRRWLGLGR